MVARDAVYGDTPRSERAPAGQGFRAVLRLFGVDHIDRNSQGSDDMVSQRSDAPTVSIQQRLDRSQARTLRQYLRGLKCPMQAMDTLVRVKRHQLVQGQNHGPVEELRSGSGDLRHQRRLVIQQVDLEAGRGWLQVEQHQ